MQRRVFSPSVRRRRVAGALRLVGLATVLVLTAAGCGSSKPTASPTSTTAAATGKSAGANANNSSAAVSTLLKQGLSQAQGRQLGQAETTFKNVLLLDPKNVYALYNLGVIDQTDNNNAGAINYYDAALSSDGTYTPAMYNKAIILEATNLAAAAGSVQTDSRHKPQRLHGLPTDGLRVRQAGTGHKSQGGPG